MPKTRGPDKKPRKRPCAKGHTPAVSKSSCQSKMLLAGNERKNGTRCCGPKRKNNPFRSLHEQGIGGRDAKGQFVSRSKARPSSYPKSEMPLPPKKTSTPAKKSASAPKKSKKKAEAGWFGWMGL